MGFKANNHASNTLRVVDGQYGPRVLESGTTAEIFPVLPILSRPLGF